MYTLTRSICMLIFIHDYARMMPRWLIINHLLAIGQRKHISLALTLSMYLIADLTLEWFAGNINFVRRRSEPMSVYIGRCSLYVWDSFRFVSIGLTIGNLLAVTLSSFEGGDFMGCSPNEAIL